MAYVDVLRTVLRSRSRRASAVALVVAAALGTGALVTASGPAPSLAAATPPLAAPGPPAAILVFVSGAVAHPGIYELASGARIADAIADAGGVLPSADQGKLPDLAGLLHDGHQVNVPFARQGGSGAATRIDVNSASAAELASVPGISSDLARAIVAERTSWGPFASLADMRTALGLDTATAALIGKHLRFLTSLP